MQGDQVGLRQQLVEGAVLHVQLLFVGGRQAVALCVEQAHAERAGAARDGSTDATEADDAERGALEVLAGEVRLRPALLPAAVAHKAVGLDEPAAQGEDQREREVGRRRVEHARRVRDGDAATAALLDVDRVVAHAVVGHDAKAREAVEHGCVDAVADGDERLDVRARPGAGEPLLVLHVVEPTPSRPRQAPGRKDLHGRWRWRTGLEPATTGTTTRGSTN